jgi:hypothetical protein
VARREKDAGIGSSSSVLHDLHARQGSFGWNKNYWEYAKRQRHQQQHEIESALQVCTLQMHDDHIEGTEGKLKISKG